MLTKEAKQEEEVLRGQVPIGAEFRHYKGQKYKVLAIARREEDLQLCVVYQALANSKDFGKNALWVRPLKDFLEMVMVGKEEVPRFQLISEMPLG